jgi:CBS domain-containing protein
MEVEFKTKGDNMEKVSDIMTKDPACCTPDMGLQAVAALMIKCDCGEIPVVDSEKDRLIVGVITDRDICCRTIGKGLNPLAMKVAEVMTFPAVTVTLDTPLEKCCQIMEANKIRRVPVVDDYNKVCGIITLADIARKKESLTLDVVREVSKPKPASLH